MTQKGCPYCDRKGLFIYPVRYAVACPTGAAGVPGLSGNFQIEDGPANIGEVKYALRSLRPGYLYTYDEKRSLLKGYIVMPRGNLSSFPIEQPAPTELPTNISCTNTVDVTMSYCVDVLHSDQNPAGTLWIGWSSSSWTPALIKMVGQAAWRSKHMQRVDIPAMLDGYARHTGEFTSAHPSVPHFATELRNMQKAFGFSNTAITHEARQGRDKEKIISGFRQRSYKKQGYIVAVDDPVGITNDLSELTVPTDSNGFDEKVYRGKIIDDLLTQTEHSVRALAKAKFAADHPVLPYKSSMGQKPAAPKSSFRSFGESVRDVAGAETDAAYHREQKKFEESRAQKVAAAADNAWKELSTIDGVSLLDDDRRRALPKQYENSIKAFEPKANKLAEAHVSWLSSLQLANWLEGVHDSDDLASGFAFRESVAQCIGKAVGTKPCQSQLNHWLSSPNTADRRNLYLRALMFNPDKIADAAKSSIGGGDIKLDSAFGIYQGALERQTRRDAPRLLDHLVLTTANVMVRALTQSGKSISKNVVIVSLSLLGRTTIRASSLSPQALSDWAVAQAVARGVQSTTVQSQTKTDALKEAKRIAPSPHPDPGICAYELDVAQLERDGRITAGSMKAVRIPGFDLTKKWLSSEEFNIGSVGVVLQLVGLYFAISEYQSADRFDSRKAGFTALVAAVSLTATIVETAATALEKTPTHPLSAYLYQHWSVGTTAAKTAIWAAKRVALIAGLCAAVIDICSAAEALKKGEYVLALLYGSSAVVGGALTVGAFVVGAAFFWITFVAAILIAIALSIYKQSMLKKWISHCFYAKGEADQPASQFYISLEEELSAYNTAVGGA